MKNKYIRIFTVLAVAILLPILSGCFTIISVTQQTTANSGEKITVTLEVRTEGTDDNAHFGILGLLIPMDWAVDTVHYSGDFGPDGMSFLHPDSADGDPGGQVDYWTDSLDVHYPPPAGMKWVVYQANTAYANPTGSVDTNYVDVTVDLMVGTIGGAYNIGYFVSNAALDFTDESYHDVKLDNPIEVAGVTPINVTLQFNSSTVLDTLSPKGFVEVRGALGHTWATGPVLPGGKTISWDKSSDLDMVNVGGDYWKVTFQLMPMDTLKYKFWTGHNSETGTYPGGGWEGLFDNTIADTRILIAGANDTIVPVQYYNPDLKLGPQPQYKKPFASKPDSLAVYFRVNMGGEMESERFNPTVNGPIGMRGDPKNSGGTFDWGSTKVILKWEEKSVYNGSFWSGVAYFDKDSVLARKQQEFKFYAENTSDFSWESGNNHIFKYPVGLKDSTIYWTWFNGKKVSGVKPVESIVTWRVSTEALEALGLFDRGVGDEIEVRGPRGKWAADEIVLYYQPLLQEWTSANESFKLPPGTEIFYKYFVVWDSSRFDSLSPNYIPGLINDDGSSRGWEEPAITGGGNRTHVFQGTGDETVIGDFGFARQFFNSVPANGVFNHDITVTWNVDMTNAADADSNAANINDLFRPGTDSVFVRWDGELLAVTQGQDMWSEEFLVLTDPDGDMVYSGSYTIQVSDAFPNGWYQLGYKITYSTATPGVHIANTGGGVERGRRYMQYIHPDNILEGTPPVTVWPSAFNLPKVNWRDTKLFVEYPPPDLTKPTGVEDELVELPSEYELEQNYPNPFNPSTAIKYKLAKSSQVSIKVYNAHGQLIATLIDKQQVQGSHSVEWKGTNDLGENVSSGIYFVKMVSGDFTKMNKMLLVR